MEQPHPVITRMEQRFASVMQERSSLSEDQSATMFAAISHIYNDVERHHHNTIHLMEMMEIIEDLDLQFEDEDAVFTALIFHDLSRDIACYRAGYEGPSNQAQTVDYVRGFLTQHDADPAFTTRVCDLIAMTEDHECPEGDHDAALFLDLDIAVIGSKESWRYNEYCTAIAKEFLGAFTPQAYEEWRGNYLTTLTQKNRIFNSDLFESEFGAQALENSRWEKDNLPGIIITARNIEQVRDIYARPVSRQKFN